MIAKEKQHTFAVRLKDVKEIVDCLDLNFYDVPGNKNRWMVKVRDKIIPVLSINFLTRSPVKTDKLIILSVENGGLISFAVENVIDIEQCIFANNKNEAVVKTKFGLSLLLTSKDIS